MTAQGRWFKAGAVGLLAAAAIVPASLAAAHESSPRAASPIRHVVVLYLENHSFDSLLGFWCDSHPARCPNGGMPSSVRLSDGTVVTPQAEPDLVPPVSHTVQAQKAAINGGKMNGWQNVGGCQASTGYACIGGYKPAQMPNLISLVDKFAISDRTFSMADSPSWGGHLYAVMASLDQFEGQNPVNAPGVPPGPGWGCNSDRITPWVAKNGTVKMVPSCVPDFSLGLTNGGAFEATPAKFAQTIMDRLDAAGLSWRIYGEPTPPGNHANGTAAGYGWDICPSFAQCLDTSQAKNNVPSATFVHAATSGHLPNFAIVTPGGKDAAFSEHNGFSMTAGDDWLGRVASAVMNGPEWKSTVLFITWDDCGCFYDQVPPGVNPDGTLQGPRVPLIIVSPYAKPGYTDTTATTFAGILAYAEHTFGLKPLSVDDAKAYDFSHAFNYHQKPLKPARTVDRPWPADAYHVNWKEADQGT